MSEVREFLGEVPPTWCPGCGDFGILTALKQALANLDLHPHEVLIISGIGCGSKLPDYMRANGFSTIHGRALAVATGAKLANHALKVIVITGDGDGYGIGGNHFLHALRRNPDLTHIVTNNQVYGLTKGQYSPTSEHGFITTTSPEGSIELAVNPLALAIAAGATFVSRGFAGDVQHLTQLIMKAIQHKGYALVDVLQPCVTFNRVNTYQWYKERAYKYKIEETGHDPKAKDKITAFQRALEWGDKIPLGIIYEEVRPTYEEQIPALKTGPLVKQSLTLKLEQYEALKREFI